MVKLKRADAAGGFKSVMHWCPGCNEAHGIRVQGPAPVWTFNGDMEKPTFAPSILCFTTYGEDGDMLRNGERRTLCHYFIKEGMIEFCGDSPHALAGKTVEIPDWPYASGEFGGVVDE